MSGLEGFHKNIMTHSYFSKFSTLSSCSTTNMWFSNNFRGFCHVILAVGSYCCRNFLHKTQKEADSWMYLFIFIYCKQIHALNNLVSKLSFNLFAKIKDIIMDQFTQEGNKYHLGKYMNGHSPGHISFPSILSLTSRISSYVY